MEKIYLLGIVFMFMSIPLSAEILTVDIKTGIDTNPGTRQKPLKTIQRAVELVNNSTGYGPSVIRIAPGLYSLEKHCLIENSRPYTEENRLIIEAEVLPGNPDWNNESMPVIVSVENLKNRDNSTSYNEISGLKIEISHVTIRGLKFIGCPVPKYWYYPVFREGKSLEDLHVSQCMFLCDPYVVSSNVAILANGHGCKVDHCVFYNCSNAVVFWNADGDISKGNAMTHCIVYGGYVSGVWLCQTDEDFIFSHNIVTNCRYAWMRSRTNRKTYRIQDCIINDYSTYSGESGENFTFSETGADVTFIENNVIKTGDIELETGEGLDISLPDRYMHVVKGTPGYDLNAGLFQAAR